MTLLLQRQLVSPADIADLAGVTKAAGSKWASSPDFPEPVDVVARGTVPVFRRDQALEWLRKHGKIATA